MSNKKILSLLALAMAMDGMGNNRHAWEREQKRELTDDEKKQKQIDIKQKSGMKLFLFNDNEKIIEIWALNHKNAVKKYKKLNNHDTHTP